MTDNAVTPNDPGLWALVVLARFHGIAADPAQIRQRAGLHGQAFAEPDLLLAAKALELKARCVSVEPARLSKLALPCIALGKDGHHFVVARAEADKILIQDPRAAGPEIVELDALRARWTGRVILIASRASLVGQLQRFDFSWFIPAVVKYRRLLLEVLGVSFAIQLFALITPLFFQVVMDKVLVHRGLTTLDVICIALLVCSAFEVLLSGLRTYVFSHTTNRIDVELGAKLFRHLLDLPLPYFAARRVGDTVARVRELENIRNFLTGQALTASIDVVFSVVFLATMCFYSVKLTAIVAASMPCYVAISMLIVPVLRGRLDEKFARGADNQSFLVETVSGIETVKAMAVEPQFTRKWDQQLASYVSAGFRVTSLANLGQQGIQMIGKLVTLLTLWIGARLVIDGKLSVGQLIAFNMLAGHVASPVLRLAQLWQDFQQVGISMQRLGDILNTRTEVPQSRQALPQLRGDIAFEDIRFRYQPDAPEVLKGVTLEIAAGEVVGVVGRSGSGKSTLTKLLQRLYVPEAGRIRIDGIDLALADPAWLRRQVGVVLQENLLFNRTIRENIALSDPSQPLDAVIEAAKLAGAHDFIIEFPQGYDTVVGEHGAGLSGGQRQRVAIARALMGNPRILIFDEATSALDSESERAIQNNMRAICAGRTVIVIAHRLSAVRHANRIVAMDKGQIVEIGPHDELIERGGYYARLVELQAA
ncbi:type I secretion system permease/ATPase [Trinickia fusca]|uniref:Cyclolysin secretion/processing ATP-binding protein CyaB n=1 Tax=Trinickia fusca TaxID=2419777 RepID=A0A494X112_9BURK|nr:type I secretion system permease/ATPase [Trinickia fusca]RKP44407.1 type I secretion system permease/ATPase [Trinickia fusca]